MKTRSLIAVLMAIAAFARSSATYAQQPPVKLANVAYNGSQLLDVFVPTQPAKRTALLFIHGGGFKQGSKDDMAIFAYLYAQGGFVSATIDYRLTSAGFFFPAQVDDVRDAIRWLKQSAPDLGFDPKRIVLIGYSAGGNLALMAGLEANSGIAAIASAAGPTDLKALVDTATLPQIKFDIDAYLRGQSAYEASPISKVQPGNPPVLLFHGAKDNFVSIAQSTTLFQKLRASNIPSSFRVLPDAGHEIMLLYPNNPSLKVVMDDITLLATLVDLQP
jgi:acetyl esterase/lipase